jgi:hypothetical protein
VAICPGEGKKFSSVAVWGLKVQCLDRVRWRRIRPVRSHCREAYITAGGVDRVPSLYYTLTFALQLKKFKAKSASVAERCWENFVVSTWPSFTGYLDWQRWLPTARKQNAWRESGQPSVSARTFQSCRNGGLPAPGTLSGNSHILVNLPLTNIPRCVCLNAKTPALQHLQFPELRVGGWRPDRARLVIYQNTNKLLTRHKTVPEGQFPQADLKMSVTRSRAELKKNLTTRPRRL